MSLSITQILTSKDEISELNKPSGRPFTTVEMPVEVMTWFGRVAIAAAKKWNAGEHGVTEQELRSYVETSGSSVSSDEWQSVLSTYLISSDYFRVLLRVPGTSEFLINQPELERFWKSQHIQAFLFVYGDAPQSIRTPSGTDEEQLCTWLKGLREGIVPGEAVPVSRAEVDLKLIGTTAQMGRTYASVLNNAKNLHVSGSLAFVVTNESLRAFDISNPREPVLLSILPAIDGVWFELLGDVGFLRRDSSSFKVLDYTDPQNPKSFHFEIYSHPGLFPNFGLALLTYGRDIVIDLSTSGRTTILNFSDRNEICKNVKTVGVIQFDVGTGTLAGDKLLLGSCNNPTIRVARISDTEVEEISTLPVETEKGGVVPHGIATAKGRLYVFGKLLSPSVPTLAVFDLSRFPNSLRFESIFELPDEDGVRELYGVQVKTSGDWLYYNDSGRIFVYDISTPAQPALVLRKDGPFRAAHIDGNRMYCADDRNIWIFDIVTKGKQTLMSKVTSLFR